MIETKGRRLIVMAGLTALLAGLAPACAGDGARGAGQGRLLIVGGGLSAENEAVHRAFVGVLETDARALVLPTASGVPAESGPGAVERLRAHDDAARGISLLEVTKDDGPLAEDPAVVAAIDDAEGIWFTGGDQARILDVFRPEGRDTAALRAMRDLIARDGVIAGTSAGAAMMSDPMIGGGRSREALLVGRAANGDAPGVEVRPGMGFFPFGIVDQHFLQRGRFGRLVAALEAADRRFGFGVSEDAALAVSLEAGRGRALGEHALVLIDRVGAQRTGLSRLDLRVSILGDLDVVVLETGEVEPAPGKRPVGRRGIVEAAGELEPFGRMGLLRMIERLALDPEQPVRARDEYFTVVVSADERTRFLARSARLDDLCAIGVRLDLVANPGAEAEAARLVAAATPSEGGER
ncbi:MAG: cyanophycinase [Planctomycetota bacterium]